MTKPNPERNKLRLIICVIAFALAVEAVKRDYNAMAVLAAFMSGGYFRSWFARKAPQWGIKLRED